MAAPFPKDSVGLVEARTFVHDAPFALASGETLERYELMYETYGTLNADASNAVLVCHALSGHHHAAGYHREDDAKSISVDFTPSSS